jgi:hypothetical protein
MGRDSAYRSVWPARWSHSSRRADGDPNDRACLGFSYCSDQYTTEELYEHLGTTHVEWRELGVPHALLVVLLFLPAIPKLFRLCRDRAARLDGRCSACNYDLRATPDRCPECGTIPTKVKA